MKSGITLEKGKMSERQVRDSIDRAAARARDVAAQQGKGEISQDSMRKVMEKNAERDKRDGKI